MHAFVRKNTGFEPTAPPPPPRKLFVGFMGGGGGSEKLFRNTEGNVEFFPLLFLGESFCNFFRIRIILIPLLNFFKTMRTFLPVLKEL